MERVRLPSPEIQGCYLKNIFPSLLSKTFSDFISDMGVTDHRHMIDNKEKKLENLRLQECSLKIRSLWKLVILLEASFK